MRKYLLLIAAIAAIGALIPATAQAWAPAATATVHPGVQTVTDGSGQCTSNFIYTQGTDVFIGQAAHCSGTGAATETNGCDSASLPLGTKVEIDGASQKGTMVYNSWIAMQQAGETDSETCEYNDLALVKIDPADVGKVNPSIPDFGGPQGVGTAPSANRSTPTATRRCAAASRCSARRTARSSAGRPGGWSYSVYTATPGIPGDSGSAFLNKNGQALGTLSTVAIAPLAGSNGVADVGKELAYARSHGFSGLQLENGTEAFQAKIAGRL